MGINFKPEKPVLFVDVSVDPGYVRYVDADRGLHQTFGPVGIQGAAIEVINSGDLVTLLVTTATRELEGIGPWREQERSIADDAEELRKVVLSVGYALPRVAERLPHRNTNRGLYITAEVTTTSDVPLTLPLVDADGGLARTFTNPLAVLSVLNRYVDSGQQFSLS